MNGLEYLLEKMIKKFNGKFLITEQVKKEIIDKPENIKKYKLEALKMKKLLEKKVLELPSSINIENKEIENKTREILKKTNHSYYAKDKFMKIIHNGEASCLALALLTKNYKTAIVVDERTTRMIGENPENLKKLFKKKLHTNVKLKSDLSFLQNIKFIRSSELVYVANKKGLVELKNHVLEALLYAVKSKGCAISTSEIENIKKTYK